MKKPTAFRAMIPVYILVLIGCVCTAHFGSRAVTVMVESSPIPNRSCIIIDAGHGGVDGGATSCTGVLESQLNLEIAIRLDELFHLLGYETRMIRTADTSVYTEGQTIAAKKVSDLKQRVRIVNETDNALLVSIHQNTFPDGRYSGAQVFYGQSGDSQTLAQKLQSAFAASVNPGSNRKSKPSDGIYLMQHIKKPGILIECGFLSNPEEEARLRSEEYQKRLSCVIASEISLFLSPKSN